MVEPVLAALIAWVLLGAGEALNTAQVAGGLLVLAGVTIAETARTATGTPVPSPPDLAQPAINSWTSGPHRDR
jgi:drug/metabolite transporter (DMT)-like permease